MARIAGLVDCIKSRYAALLAPDLIIGNARRLGYRWREGPLNPVRTVHLFLLQVLHGNTACSHLRHLAERDFTASAYCQARMRLPLALFESLLRATVAQLRQRTEEIATWHGHRTFVLDGSSFSMPDTPELRERFGYPPRQKPGCGFPVAHLMALCDLTLGVIIDVLAAPVHAGDITQGVKLHPLLQPGDLVVADRSFGTWGYLALVLQQNLHAVVRAHQRLMIHFDAKDPWHKRGTYCRRERLGSGGLKDQVIEWFKPKQGPRWLSREQYDALPQSIMVRTIRYRLRRPGFRTKEVTLLTTLLDHKTYPARSIAELYGRRWEIETNFRYLKRAMGMAVLRCQTVEGVKKELIMFAIAYNLVRQLCLAAGERQGIDPLRISFVDALRWLCWGASAAPPGDLLVNPQRPGRIEPRALKRRPIEQRWLTIPREQARQHLIDQSLAA